MNNLKRPKKETITWAKEKQIREEADLRGIGEELESLESPEEDGYEIEEKRDRIKILETRRREILNDIEEQWRIKSRAIWLSAGDENTKVFQNYAKGRKKTQIPFGNCLGLMGVWVNLLMNWMLREGIISKTYSKS